jgi:hypothetical protein
MAAPVILERFTRVAPLGLRFWDALTNTFISDGLQVQAVPKLVSGVFYGQPIPAFANRTGVFVFQGLPGLREQEFGAGDDAYWNKPPEQKEYLISVEDKLRRFLPFQMALKAPVKGIVDFSSPGGKPAPKLASQPQGVVPLFSSPGRSVPGAVAILRAGIVRVAGNPARWAMVEAYSKNKIIARGMTDGAGQLGLFFPYPKIVLNNPMDPRPPLTEQTWPVDLKVFSALSPPPGEQPDLAVVVDQPQANPLRELAPNKPLQTLELTFGQELIVKTKNQSELFIA